MKLGNSYELFAEATGLRLKSIKVSSSEPVASEVSQFLASLASLKADGVFEVDGNDLVASLDHLLDLETREIDPLSYLFEWSPLVLKIEGKGALGFEDFKFIPRFYLGKRAVQLRSVGVIAWRSQALYRLPAAQALALALIEDFNSGNADTKTKARSLDSLYRLKTLAKANDDIRFDEYLASENVIKPESVGLAAQDDGSRAIVYPLVNGVSEDALKKQFLNISEVQDVYDIDPGNGQSRQRLVISSELKEVLKTIKRTGFGISGRTRENFYRNPLSLLPEGEGQNQDLIELVGFGPRVKGIGFPAFVRAIKPSTQEDWFGNAEREDRTKKPKPSAVAIECAFVDGESKLVEFDSNHDAQEFVATIRAELAKGNHSVQWDDTSIPISDSFANMVESQIQSADEEKPSTPSEDSKPKRLLIHTNEESVDYAEPTNDASFAVQFENPRSLKSDVKLKAHQLIGVGWMSGLLNRDLSKGALLADDMGLGKTLQLLTFLAWCIETELKDLVGKDTPPYEPILIVAPLILLDTWEREINKYFEPGTFAPLEKLHGSSLKKYRKEGSNGRETEPGIETLDIQKLRTNRIIITNYETVKNYQYTFAKIPWSVLVVDEAQEIKEPSTAVTYALKVLNPTFRIASTGTPVETSLSNLWSIMDFAQPGNKLGSLKSFNKEFGALSYDDPTLGERLREALGFNSDTGLILRRAKKDVLKDLPPKTTVEHFCEMDHDLELKYQSVIKLVQESSRGNIAALQGLHQISQISQHPFLIEGEPFRGDHREYLKASSKLRKLVEILSDIKSKSEKVLVFTRSRKMQDILKAVIDAEFKLDVGIVNGDTASRHKYVSNTREGIIERFSEKPDFNILILSPEVAGVGLTITAANHVVHYGRWWNPAKENQATDRAYRIGQTKPVFVHHLLLKNSNGTIETFDQKLHRLLKVREDLADNFLVPNGDESAIQSDLLGNIFSSDLGHVKASPSANAKPTLERLTPFEFECATAILFRSRCKDVFVTPRTGDRGIDVVGVSEKEVVLIQCKKLNVANVCQPDVLNELVDGADYYREYVLPKAIKHLPIKLILVTTGKSDRTLANDANSKGIELVDGNATKKMYATQNFTNAEINALDSIRPRNVDSLAQELTEKFQKKS